MPHQLRGFLAQFRNMPIVGPAYNRCTGCSETVLAAYEKDGFEMLLKAFNDTEFLPELTGLKQMYEETQAALDVRRDVDETMLLTVYSMRVRGALSACRLRTGRVSRTGCGGGYARCFTLTSAVGGVCSRGGRGDVLQPEKQTRTRTLPVHWIGFVH